MNEYPDGELWTKVPATVRKHLEGQWDRVRAPYGSPTILFSVVHTVENATDRPGGVVYDGIVAADVISVRSTIKDTVMALRVRATVHAHESVPIATAVAYESRSRVIDAAIGAQAREVARLYGYDWHQIALISDEMVRAAAKESPPWRGCSRAGWGSGPWDNEGDREAFTTENGHDAVILRNHVGAWCGYIAVPVAHPWWGRSSSDLLPVSGREISYAAINGPPGDPVHVGENAKAWVVGFHMSEGWDIVPAPRAHDGHYRGGTYRTIADAREMAEELSVAAAYGPDARLCDGR